MDDVLERITARRAELDAAVGRLAKELEAVRAEPEELACAERVLIRLNAQAAAGADETSGPTAGQVADRAVLLVPHRDKGMDEKALPEEYWRVFDVVRSADDPAMAQDVCRLLGISAEPRFREAMRSRLNRPGGSSPCCEHGIRNPAFLP
ncbi:hypothetical protein AB0D12_02720 [Streptomyces sp. NPDC048479]|uniref:hypothetical protein n=1 Tax=Streptomyces sp. NPDC048479 TaxID=3154725 RepID=UPI0034192E33